MALHTVLDTSASPNASEFIDEEHREIISLIREFDELLSQGGTKEQLVDLFAVAFSNIKSHFQAEEAWMREFSYARYQAHKTDHDNLIDELCVIMWDLERGAYSEQHSKLGQRVADWFDSHFEMMDAAMIKFAHQQPRVGS